MMLAFFLLLLVFVPALDRVNRAPRPEAESGSPSWTSLDEVYNHLATRRALQVARLREYAYRGVFPRNSDFPGELVPYFVDKFGTHCAVGELVRLDGRGDLVAEVVASNNHVRISDVKSGPLLDWIADSGLTKAECALIQPSYARIEDYRQHRQWQDEVERLQTHFDKVEKTLRSQEELSLSEAMRLKVNDELLNPIPDPAFTPASFLKSLAQSKEPNVRIAAAYALARISSDLSPRSTRINALEESLTDDVPEVRFWAAVAMERIGSASAAGSIELHRRTLPVFLDIVRNGPAQLREAALMQLAKLTPDSINSSVQLRIVPDVRRVMVEACDDRNDKVKKIANDTLKSWRWQRIVYESDRMARQYLADTHELESQVAEALLLNRGIVSRDTSVEALQKKLADVDIRHTSLRTASREEVPVKTAETKEQALKIAKDFLTEIYKKYIDGSFPSDWHLSSKDFGDNSLLLIVEHFRDEEFSSKLNFLVPTPGLLQEASVAPGIWLESKQYDGKETWPQGPEFEVQPRVQLRVELGTLAMNSEEAFRTSCDIFTSLMSYYALIRVDGEVQTSLDSFVWSGRFATARSHKPRFFELGGGGSSRSGGGGWDFLTLTMTCDRKTGELKLATEPIEYPIVQRPESELTPEWRIRELRLMGWQPLSEIDFFGDRLFPAEYNEAVKLFREGNRQAANDRAYRHWRVETSLPSPYLLLSILAEEAGDREEALKYIDRAVANERYDPRTLADAARWEASLGLDDSARKHAEAALKLWPDCPQAQEVLGKLGDAD